jgi:hypothetical protein
LLFLLISSEAFLEMPGGVTGRLQTQETTMSPEEIEICDQGASVNTGEFPRNYRRIFFQHIQKTGGTSVLAMLQNFVPSASAYGYRDLGADPVRRYMGPSRAILFFDHQPILHNKIRETFAFAFFRDPFARLLSARRQVTDATDADIAVMKPLDKAPFLAMRNMTMEQILDAVFDYPITVSWFWNHQALMLGLWPMLRAMDGWKIRLNTFDRHFADRAAYRAWYERNRSNILKNAITTLRSLDYVGLNEDFEISVREVFTRLGLPEPEFTMHLNARAAYQDEKNQGLKDKAAPFIDLDQEIYEEAKELHARSGRAQRGAPVEFFFRLVSVDEDRRFGPEEAPGGHGWHPATLREDHVFSRWSGPMTRSFYTFHATAGEFRVEIWFFGAVSPRAIHNVSIAINGERAPIEVEMSSDAHYLIIASFANHRDGRVEICIEAGETVAQCGLQLEHIRVVGALAPTYVIGAHEWRARRRGLESNPVWMVKTGEDITFTADRFPEGHGWRRASIRQDGGVSRWSGRYCEVPVAIQPGAYRALVRICGAASPTALPGLRILVDGAPVDTTIRPADNDRYEASFPLHEEVAGTKIIRIDVPETVDGYGIEVEAFRFVGNATSEKTDCFSDPE